MSPNDEFRILGRRTGNDESVRFEYKGVSFDQDTFHVVAGLNAVDTRENVERTFAALKAAGQLCARMGAYKPRTSPYSFQGYGRKCLPWVFELAGKYGIRVISMEVTHDEHVDEIREALRLTGDPAGAMLQIGTRNTQNFELLKTVGSQREFPILLKRGFGITLHESLLAAEYVASEGNRDIVFCLRGVKTNFGDPHRNLVDFGHVGTVKRLTRMPVCVDPSHSVGDPGIVARGDPRHLPRGRPGRDRRREPGSRRHASRSPQGARGCRPGAHSRGTAVVPRGHGTCPRGLPRAPRAGLAPPREMTGLARVLAAAVMAAAAAAAQAQIDLTDDLGRRVAMARARAKDRDPCALDHRGCLRGRRGGSRRGRERVERSSGRGGAAARRVHGLRDRHGGAGAALAGSRHRVEGQLPPLRHRATGGPRRAAYSSCRRAGSARSPGSSRRRPRSPAATRGRPRATTRRASAPFAPATPARRAFASSSRSRTGRS